MGIKLPYNAAITSLVKATNLRVIRELHGPPVDYEVLETAAKTCQ